MVVKVGGGANNYPFAPVPEGWSIGANMSLGPTKIKRKKVTPQGDSKDFYLSPDAYRDLWRAASEFWAPVPGFKTSIKLKTENGDRTFNFKPHYVAFGFIVIYRHELEQVAKYRGWEFPVAVKLAA